MRVAPATDPRPVPPSGMTQPTVTLPVVPADVTRLDDVIPTAFDARWGATVYVVAHHPEGDQVQVVVAPGPDFFLATRWGEDRCRCECACMYATSFGQCGPCRRGYHRGQSSDEEPAA